MKPVLIFRHTPTEGPGHIAVFLQQRGIPFQTCLIDQGDPIPASPEAYAGLVFMGGPMSVNDDLPWIADSLALIRHAIAADIPVLGHCLGGQLIARALGGEITTTPIKEIGWEPVSALNNPSARAWFGDTTRFDAFHWHGETFSIPANATRILKSAHCPNQAFALGPHLALQCHVEMTTPMIHEWCRVGADYLNAAQGSPAVQSAAVMQTETPHKLPAMTAIADRLYTHWIKGLTS
ncbi:MAG: type 1 glutamine amidotransferase [Betaproteobacteria bacterium]|nr:MAG: type 1 glutamine amidotransferase [Betaproteobacteria bacterium]